MRVALLSDIHGNLAALKSVLRAVRTDRADIVVCLGDVAATGPNPHEAIEALRSASVRCVMGNTDDDLLAMRSGRLARREPGPVGEIDEWCARQLTPADVDSLRSYGSTITVGLGGGDILAFHGTPRSSRESIPSDAPGTTLDEIFQGCDALVMAGGHSHRQMLRRHRGYYIVNPGSVGLPYQVDGKGRVSVPPWYEYAMVSLGKQGLEVTFRRVTHASDPSISKSAMPHSGRYHEVWARHMSTLLSSMGT